MEIIFITIFTLFFIFITWYRFHWGLFFLFLLLPTYLIRFNIGPLPTTLLEVMIWIILIIWLTKFKPKKNISYLLSLISKNKSLFIASSIFLLAATISIFTSTDLRAAAGQWKAFYIEPFLIFLVLITTINDQRSTIKNLQSSIFFALILCGLATSALAIYQHFTGFMVPYAFWENRNTFRITGWYGFPNGVGLFLAQLFPLALYLVRQSWSEFIKIIRLKDYKIIKLKKYKNQNNNLLIFQSFNLQFFIFILSILFLITSPLATYFAKSTGGLIGILAGIGILLLLDKKTRIPTIILGIIGISSLFGFSSLSSLKNEVFMQDRSGQIRISMWQDTTNFLKDNFFLGAGLASYEERIVPYHTTVNGEGIEIFHHPHNIFLTMWVNTGLLGLVGFILILIWFFKESIAKIKRLKDYKIENQNNNLSIFQSSSLPTFLLSSMVVLITTGLVDSPYIKNDLALLFWLLPALLIISTQYEKLPNPKT